MEKGAVKNNETINQLFKVGAHFAYTKSRRHPSAKPFIFGAKNKIEIFDLEKTKDLLAAAKNFVQSVAETGGMILFVGGKNEARLAVKNAATSIGMPYVAGRWIGGTLTNFPQIRKRVQKLEDLTKQREKGELAKYTKKERLLIDREIAKLEQFFSGLAPMRELPKAVFVIDSKREHIAVEEAAVVGVPVLSLSGSDCDLKKIMYPIPGNDTAMASIQFFVNEIISAYKGGLAQKEKAKAPDPK